MRRTTSSFVSWITCSSAASQFDFSGVARPPRGAWSAVITTLASQPLIRAASASEEKPAKTIEWIAPMRAQASMA